MLPAALQVVAGCNSVLGIEPAELGETTQALECQWYEPNPVDCPACDEGCAGICKVDECLKDEECRVTLFRQRKCVGAACTDSKGECGGCTSDNPMAATIEKCLKDKCGGCGLAGSFTLCEGYCACMHQQCPANEPNGKAADDTGCLTACMHGMPTGVSLPLAGAGNAEVAAAWLPNQAPPDWQIGCFWYHCGAATSKDDGFHCDHAIGIGGGCAKKQVPDPHATLCDYPKGYKNAPCNGPGECCSGSCRADQGLCE
jgi:hypothetical protein